MEKPYQNKKIEEWKLLNSLQRKRLIKHSRTNKCKKSNNKNPLDKNKSEIFQKKHYQTLDNVTNGKKIDMIIYQQIKICSSY